MTTDTILFYLVPAASLTALLFAWIFFRKMMKERGVRKLDVCFTQTPPVQTGGTVASMPFAPAACGVRMGAYIVERLLV